MLKAFIKYPAFAVLALFLPGCGNSDGLTRVTVQGNVRYHGQSVADGQIRFVPEAATLGPVTIGPISNGKYEFNQKGGVPVGKHRIEILSWDPRVPEPSGRGMPPRPQFLPAKYNERSELTMTLDDQSGVVTKDFDLN